MMCLIPHLHFRMHQIFQKNSESILQNLSNTSFIKYRKPHKIIAAQEKAEVLRSTREIHSRSKKSWQREELIILKRFVRLNMPVDEIAKHLERTPAEVNQRIAYQRKYNQL